MLICEYNTLFMYALFMLKFGRKKVCSARYAGLRNARVAKTVL